MLDVALRGRCDWKSAVKMSFTERGDIRCFSILAACALLEVC